MIGSPWWWWLSLSCLTLATPKTVTHQAPLSMRCSRQSYWSGLSFPSPGMISPYQLSSLYIVVCICQSLNVSGHIWWLLMKEKRAVVLCTLTLSSLVLQCILVCRWNWEFREFCWPAFLGGSGYLVDLCGSEMSTRSCESADCSYTAV